jgi:hypothetical protein
MLTMKPQTSLRNAEPNFREYPGVSDYYMEGRSVLGQGFGEEAKELKLSGFPEVVSQPSSAKRGAVDITDEHQTQYRGQKWKRPRIGQSSGVRRHPHARTSTETQSIELIS